MAFRWGNVRFVKPFFSLSEPACKMSDVQVDQGRASQPLIVFISWGFWIISPRMEEFWRGLKRIFFHFSLHYLQQEIKGCTAVLKRTFHMTMLCSWDLHQNISCLIRICKRFELVEYFICVSTVNNSSFPVPCSTLPFPLSAMHWPSHTFSQHQLHLPLLCMSHNLPHPLWQALYGKGTSGEKRDSWLSGPHGQASCSGLAFSSPAGPCSASEWPWWGPSPVVERPISLLQRRNKVCQTPWWPALSQSRVMGRWQPHGHPASTTRPPAALGPYALHSLGTSHQTRNCFSCTTTGVEANASNGNPVSSALMAAGSRLSIQLEWCKRVVQGDWEKEGKEGM